MQAVRLEHGLAMVTLLGILLVCGERGFGAGETRAEMKPIVLGYYPSWPCGLSPSEIRYDLFTHLAHAFVTATTEGAVQHSGGLPSSELVERAHAAGVKVLVSVGGADSGACLGDVCLKETSRARFVQELVGLVEAWHYDGVDLDWEFPRNTAERDALTTLARELRKRLGPNRLLVSAQSGAKWACRYVDMQALRESFDWVAVMTYDMHGPWSSHAGHNAPLHTPKADAAECSSNSLTAFMRFWQEEGKWSTNKLLVGIPCYGRGFRVPLYRPLPRQLANHPREYVAFRQISELVAKGWVKQWDAEAQVPWLESPAHDEILSYEDEASAKIKGAWARAQGYGGIFFWEISQDATGQGRHPIIEAARASFLGEEQHSK